MSCGKIDVEISTLAVHQGALAGIKVGSQVSLSQGSEKVICSDAAGNVLGFAASVSATAELNGTSASVRSVRRSPQGEVVQLLVRTTGKRVNVNVVALAGIPSRGVETLAVALNISSGSARFNCAPSSCFVSPSW